MTVMVKGMGQYAYSCFLSGRNERHGSIAHALVGTGAGMDIAEGVGGWY